MRRALNILQACHAAYDITDETAIYNCTGNPHPADVEIVVNSMLSEEFTTSYNSTPLLIPTDQIHKPRTCIEITQLKTERGLALQDLISGVYDVIDTIAFAPHVRVYLLDHLATTEYVFRP